MYDIQSNSIVEPNEPDEPNQQDNQPEKKKPSKIQSFFVTIIVIIFIIGYAILRLHLLGPILDHFSESDRENAEATAVIALTNALTIDTDVTWQENMDRICANTTVDFCKEFKASLTEQEFNDNGFNINCEIDNIEYLEKIKLVETNQKGISFRVQYHIYLMDDEELSLPYDEVAVMVKDNGWKLYNTISYEDYDNATASN